jgi:hypothetical protein
MRFKNQMRRHCLIIRIAIHHFMRIDSTASKKQTKPMTGNILSGR